MREIKFRVWENKIMNYNPSTWFSESTINDESSKVEVIKEVLPEKEQNEKEILEFVKYFSGKVPSMPIDRLGKHLQGDKRVQEIYLKAS